MWLLLCVCLAAPIFARADSWFLQIGNILADLQDIDLLRGEYLDWDEMRLCV